MDICARYEGLGAVPGEAAEGPDGTRLPKGRDSPGGLGSARAAPPRWRKGCHVQGKGAN